MANSRPSKGFGAFAPVLFVAAGLAATIPVASLALPGENSSISLVNRGGTEFAPFTPANVDPALAARVARSLNDKGQAMRFTPAGSLDTPDRAVTVAVRLDDRTARAISMRSAIKSARGAAGLGMNSSGATLAVAPMRYNLGVARGYQTFSKPIELPSGVRESRMPDLSSFRPASDAEEKPGRFQPRIALESDDAAAGRAPRTLEGLGEQSVNLGGAYRLAPNLNVTAGVRLSQDRDRIAPLTDGVEDDKAVYVGTQFRF